MPVTLPLGSQKAFVNAPEGQHQAVLIDVVDLGIVETKFGEKHQVKLVFETATKMEDGKPYLTSKRYTASLNEKSVLFKDLKSWVGKELTGSKFTLDSLVGRTALLIVTHTERDDKVWANITAILKDNSGKELKPTGDYTRVQDRKEEAPF
jgi:hypothetical protein